MAFTRDQLRTFRELASAPQYAQAGPKVRKALGETAIVESNVNQHPSERNLDSIGVLQQRPSQGWGSPQQLSSVRYQAEQFLKRAIPIAGKYGSSGQLAQAVQRSAFPERYDQHSAEAAQLLAAIGGHQGAHAMLSSMGAGHPPEAATAASPGSSPAQTADIVSMLQAALAPQQGASVAGTALPRPQSSGGAYQSPTTPHVPSPLTPQPQSSAQDNVLGLLSKLSQDAPTTEVAGGAQPTPAVPLPAASSQAQGKLASIVATANRIGNAHVPYLWGGGHAGKVLPGSKVTPLDCSGAVSAALGINPKVSGEFEGWGAPGKGKNVTIWANAEHVLMEVNGRFWGTSHANPGGGAGWIKPGVISKSYLRNFTARHPGKL